MIYKLEGKVKLKSEPKKVSEKFTVMDLIIETKDEKYPQVLKFQASNDKCHELKNYSINEEVEISFDLRGREYNGNYYTTLNVVSIKSTLF
jgi:single-strand DNA-binding protein